VEIMQRMRCYYAKWVPCHHIMAHSLVGDGRDGLHIWIVATNIMNKQLNDN